jgi:hypothetical protein
LSILRAEQERKKPQSTRFGFKLPRQFLAGREFAYRGETQQLSNFEIGDFLCREGLLQLRIARTTGLVVFAGPLNLLASGRA